MTATTVFAITLSETTVVAQAPSSSAATKSTDKTSSVPKTPWGRPDLQGIWSGEGIVVPFQRPKEFGDRQLMTEAEHQKAVEDLLKRNARPGRDSREANGKDIRGTEKDVARAYNDLWFDKQNGVSYRTSQIIDPPDGRMPASHAGGTGEKQQATGLSCGAFAGHVREASLDRSPRSDTNRRPITTLIA